MIEKDQSSLFENIVFNVLKTITTIVFPIITYPYITRVLSVRNFGRINFSQSIVSYFALLAGLGIQTFAIRTGSQLRDSYSELNTFARRVFSINIISTMISVTIMISSVFLVGKLFNYRYLILIQTFNIVFSPLAVDWLYILKEDFRYITTRSFFVYLLSLILMFCFVRSSEDVYIYVTLCVAANVLGNVINYIHARKYALLCFTRDTHWSEYGHSILVFFVNSIATVIYINSDVTLLGIFCGDYEVGLYGVSSKIYGIVKQLFNSAVASIIPRLAYLQSNDKLEFNRIVSNVLSTVTLLLLPGAIGIIILRNEIIYLVSGKDYARASSSLSILGAALIFAVLANVFANAILICVGRERIVVKATLISASANVVLNIFLIPFMAENGAALTTLIAELIVFCISIIGAREYVKTTWDAKLLFHVIFCSTIMWIVCHYVYIHIARWSAVLRIICIAAIGAGIYGFLMMLLKDKTFIRLFNHLKDMKGQSS